MSIFNFKYKEIIKSDTADRSNINNDVPEELFDNLMLLSYGIQLVRNLLCVPIKITSGYRCPTLNKLVGGSINSYHMNCLAIDFIPIRMNIEEAYMKIAKSNIPFDKLILEKNSRGKIWIHIQFSKTAPRKQYFELIK